MASRKPAPPGANPYQTIQCSHSHVLPFEGLIVPWKTYPDPDPDYDLFGVPSQDDDQPPTDFRPATGGGRRDRDPFRPFDFGPEPDMDSIRRDRHRRPPRGLDPDYDEREKWRSDLPPKDGRRPGRAPPDDGFPWSDRVPFDSGFPRPTRDYGLDPDRGRHRDRTTSRTGTGIPPWGGRDPFDSDFFRRARERHMGPFSNFFTASDPFGSTFFQSSRGGYGHATGGLFGPDSDFARTMADIDRMTEGLGRMGLNDDPFGSFFSSPFGRRRPGPGPF
ncbi:c84bd6f9-050b-4ff8-b246-074c7a6fd47a [Thermothielavioides terrestris]|uniref:C84bd6f9-050b-4ff8-b246-074c7a6fd47a n=1 Tax=Thermothielavioides terrestris TaxID=2587410 RepID=A0A446BBC7_9PEZI|nr:c84bd6f9-050b-4ff8-b246-074c7a6fd47a [Thermothielavioides terrestris]